MAATEHLLEEFPPVSTADWEAAIARDLKGADYEKRLMWRAEDGLAVKPYYRAEDLKDLAQIDAAPGEFPFRRGTRTTGDWRIREEIDAVDAESASRAAREAVAAGADEIAFTAASVQTKAALDLILAGLDEIPVHFRKADKPLLGLLLDRMRMRPRRAEVTAGCDALASTEFAAEVIGAAPDGFVPFAIDGAFEEAGATVAEEVGFTLAAGVDYLAAMEECGADVGRAAAAIEFGFAIGSSYFLQIAKLRAFRMTWARAAGSFGGAHEWARARIATRTSRWNKTVYDPHVNILRATTEAIAAVLGGADSVTVAPFDECYESPDEASRRLARDTQLVLKHEASMGRVADAAGGSYLIEWLTDAIAREAWKRMQEIEAQGGYRKAQAAGAIGKALKRSRTAREKAVATRWRVVVGTNQFANPAERALDRIDSARANAELRGARIYEELRLRTERHAAEGERTPRILLAETGDVKMRMARSNFAANFFACAGLATTTRRFRKAAEIAADGADLVVLCSSDAEYAAIVAEVMAKLKEAGKATPVIIAGNPEDAEKLAVAGVADFVHARSNPVEVLTKWQERLGIKE
jgi:methylmalonyl-CoA mutase